MKPTSVQSIHFPRSEQSCKLLERTEQVLPDGLCCGEFDGPGDLCVAVATVEGAVSVFKSSLGARVWTQVSGLGCVGALLPLRAAAPGGTRDLLLAVTAGERVMTLLDLFGGAIWKARIEPVVEACAWEAQGNLVALASSSGVTLYQLAMEGQGKVKCETLQSWRLEDSGSIDCVSFAEGALVASLTSGAVYRLPRERDGAAECLRREGPHGWGPSKTRSMGERLVAISMDGLLRLAEERGDSGDGLEFALAEEQSLIFSFKTSRVLRIGDECAVTACATTGDTWFVDLKGNVLLFSPLSAQDPSASVVAFDIHKSRVSNESHIVYLLASGEVLLFALDLTCLECRLFSKHANAFVQKHPLFASLNAKQRSELVNLAMKFTP